MIHSRFLIFLISLPLPSSVLAAPYDNLSPKMREEIMKNMSEMESLIQAGSDGGPTLLTKQDGEYVVGAVPSPQDINWISLPEPQAKLISYMAGQEGTVGAGVFGSPKSVSRLDKYYQGRLGLGWRRHRVNETQIIFLQGGPATLPVKPDQLFQLLKTTHHVVISQLDEDSMMFDQHHASSIEITSE